ncbi:sigma-70 family RNA polymerase sigma factor family protein [Paractinoplanes durhamensis]|uniref:Nuclear transport factor 2 family protein n=1 Tax=Paractinoplanes durhamensis TaxID=113563 RepID=A0ABQ3ZCC3_9ACTN|nr:hypothetical protein [Actinoplanes durhamensis]GIE07184.1 hypothetical protein Adu01nite_85340 [Actinoplanes durhamensis]
MGVDLRLEELGVSGLGEVDEPAFTGLAERHRRELHVHVVVRGWIEDGFEGMTGLRGVATSVNRQPAVAFYLWQKREGAYLPLTLDVLRVTGGAITEIFTFHSDRFARLGLPDRLPADGTE